jgi:tyrosine-protein kinase Etk/Wzc
MLQSNNNVIAISGPSPGVGKSFVSSNLAAVLAAGEKRILLIDGDMRKGYLHKTFALNPENGLSDILSGTRNYYDVIKKSSLDKLDIITRGAVPPNPSELLMHGLFDKLIENVKADYDVVLIDTPPILAVTDPSIIAKHAGSTILVTRYAQNPVREIELACKRFENAGTTIHGAILNDIKRSAANKYGYYGYYNYEYNSDKN